ncbi:hypothetical protein Kpol_449p2 [Vanderwaltozyma polyspora DSM 70294]|uniref:Uncharacterized protein n=1 Tax=Vanderwaltozyma polyspora (strain ATCC 22028 / DSM 70294 / BCRC 21397 / CBS 2163 / NBRC 10782 / NRRL Y-8283 / UCD 57-17) TaxID=436907 RepID=A7TR12_VANPO|nr:uncharacterized protein Kpol_449p2 [Vanderwaltozyma polyspora DSM 70294]EDO15287.1 hypothetical protein Kpol_449p2 [Vanderwaltozyma polyspora DSM 70294]
MYVSINSVKLYFTVLAAVKLVSGLTVESPGSNNVTISDKNSLENIKQSGGIVYVSNSENITDYISMYANTDIVIKDNSTGIVYSNIFKWHEEDNSNPIFGIHKDEKSNGIFAKKDPIVYDVGGWHYFWDQLQTIHSGEWWSPWYPVSQCFDNSLSGDEAVINIGYGYYYGWSMERILFLNEKALSASTGYSVSRSISKSAELECHIPAGTDGQVWYQQRMMWADVQTQGCSKSGSGKTACGRWTAYNRINAPIKGESSNSHFDCRTGDTNIDCNANIGDWFRLKHFYKE